MRRSPLATALTATLAILAAAPRVDAKVDVVPTAFSGEAPRLAPAKDGSLHLLYYAPGALRHARLVSGAWVGDAALPDSGSVSRAKYNRPSLAVGPDSTPHAVWGPVASWTDATTHTKGVWYWNGTATTQIFADYTEYVALGIDGAGKKFFATAVVFLPGDTTGTGVGWAELKGTTLDPVARFTMSDGEGKHVSFCRGDDGNLHLVWRFQRVRYSRHDGSGWSAVEGLGGPSPSSAELPSCAVDAKGRPHVAWLRWQDTGGGKWAPVDLRYATKKTTGWSPTAEGSVVRALAAGGTSPGVAVDGDTVLLAWTEGGTLWSSVSLDAGATFAPAEAQATDVDPGSDLSDNSPKLPLVVHDARFQTVYTRKDGKLVRAVWAPPAPIVDAGDGAESDAAADATADSAPADAGGEAGTSDAKGSEAGSDLESGDLGGGCGCRLGARDGDDDGDGRASGAVLLALVGLAGRTRRSQRARASRDRGA